MTAQTLARVAETLTKDGVTWQIFEAPRPGPCDLAWWCEDLCEDLAPRELGTEHGRDVALALIDGDPVVQICVGQWKANPKHGIKDTGSCFALNLDKAPLVGIYAYPPGAPSRATFLRNPWGRTLAEALRLVGHDPFADALDIAACLAQEIDEERRAARPRMEEKR